MSVSLTKTGGLRQPEDRQRYRGFFGDQYAPLIYRATTAGILKSIDQQLLLIGVKLPPERGVVFYDMTFTLTAPFRLHLVILGVPLF